MLGASSWNSLRFIYEDRIENNPSIAALPGTGHARLATSLDRDELLEPARLGTLIVETTRVAVRPGARSLAHSLIRDLRAGNYLSETSCPRGL